METAEKLPQEQILSNIIKILNERNLTRSSLIEPLELSDGSVSKLLNGQTKLSYDALSKIASFLSISVIDIITYPDKYVPVMSPDAEPLEAILQIKLKKEKKDQVLKLVFGDNNFELLNK